MEARALGISPYARKALAAGGMGHVEGAFATSFNVRLGDSLVHVGRACDEPSCTGLSVAAGEMAELLRGLAGGAVCIAGEEGLRVYRADGAARILTGNAEVLDCFVPRLGGAADAAWALAELEACAGRDACGLPPAPEVGASLSVLANPANKAELEVAIHYLTGRGQGLTPSGDDALLGYACARAAFGMAEGLGELIWAEARERTTPVSASYAQAFAAGYVNPVYTRLLKAVAARDVAAFAVAREAIAKIGHTSGTDALLGIKLGLSYVATHAAGALPASATTPAVNGQ